MHTHAGNITTNLQFRINFTIPEVSATKIVTWNCHVHNSAKGKYVIILCGYILTAVVLNIKLSEHVVKADYGTLRGSSAPMVHLGTY